MSPGCPFIFGSKVKGQGHESINLCRHGSLHSCECWLLLVTVIIDVRRLRADDPGGLASDGHGPSAATARCDVDADVALCRLGASLGVVEHLLSLAILVHRYRHNFLLPVPAPHRTSCLVAEYSLSLIHI